MESIFYFIRGHSEINAQHLLIMQLQAWFILYKVLRCTVVPCFAMNFCQRTDALLLRHLVHDFSGALLSLRYIFALSLQRILEMY